MDNESVTKEIDRKNEIFISELMNKNSFMLDWYAGAVLPKHHPKYYDGRIEVNIRKVFNSSYGNISFGKDEYQITDKLVDNLYNYIDTNINKLIKLSLNQSTEMYDGINDSLSIKYKSIYISISEVNVTSEEERSEISKIKADIKNIICVNKLTNNYSSEDEISDEKIETIVNNLVETDNMDKKFLLSKITKKIVHMPANIETTIAQLMQLNDNDVAMIEPLMQGEIFNTLKKVCEKLKINIEVNHDEISGLAYYYKFKKILNTPDIKKTKVVITEESIDENGRASGAIKEVYVPAVKKDIDSTVKMLVNKIKELPVNTEISVSELLGLHINDYETKELFEINKKVLSTCKENGITLNFDKYKDEIVGLPYNIPFIKE